MKVKILGKKRTFDQDSAVTVRGAERCGEQKEFV